MKSNVITSFIPWILFFALFGHSAGSQELAASIALASHVIFNYKNIRRYLVLDLGALCFFVLFAINVFIFKIDSITNNGYLISNIALAAIAWISIIIKRPFTLQYARSMVTEDVAISRIFIFINYLLTIIWAICFSLMIVPNLIELNHHINHADAINIGVTIILILFAAWVTGFLPDRLVNYIILKHLTVNIKDIYAKQHTKPTDFTTFKPEHLHTQADKTTDVLIVGAGPIGLAFALLLQQHGIDFTIIEKHPGTSRHPKARGISCRSMELFKKLGVEEKIKQFNIPKQQLWFGWYKALKGKRYAKIHDKTDHSIFSPCETGSAAQHFVEPILVDHIKENRILFNHELEDFSQNNDVSQATIRNKTTNSSYSIQAKYVIGADGSHSTLRNFFDIPMLGPEEITLNCSIYCEINLDDIFEPENRFSIAYLIDMDRASPMVLSIDGKRQWVFIFPSPGVSQDKLESLYTDDYAIQQIRKVIGQDDLPVNIISKQVWSLGSQIANQFIAGNVYFAGDAIHQFSPTGGMGMNTGLQDVDNLAWKIAYSVKGFVNPGILTSYEIERAPSILENMQWSLDNLQRLVKIQQTIDNKNLETMDFQTHAEQQNAHLNKSGLDLGTIYSSDIIAKESQSAPAIIHSKYQPTTYPGARLPHVPLIREEQTISSLDLVSTHFILLVKASDIELAKSINFKSIPNKIIEIGEQGNVQEVAPNDFFTETLWVRPDGHIAWRGKLKDTVAINRLIHLINQLT